jgi:hypothetical protein
MIQSLSHKHNQDVSYEDPRTSTIFDALLHLPDEMIWEVLRKACPCRTFLPEKIGVLQRYEFWPKWAPEGTENCNYVEPDVFLHFDETDLIIEAKRSDEDGQYFEEWQREFIAYDNEYGLTDVPAFLIAFGGNGNNMANETIVIKDQVRTIVKCSWANLYGVLLEKHKELAGSERRVVESLLLACRLFGFRSYKWLETRTCVSGYGIALPDDYHTLIFKR